MFVEPIHVADVDGYTFDIVANGFTIVTEVDVSSQKPGFTGVRLFAGTRSVELVNTTTARSLSFPGINGAVENINHMMLAFEAAWHIESPVCQTLAREPVQLADAQFCYAPVAYGKVPYEIPPDGSAVIDLYSSQSFGGAAAEILTWASGVGEIPEDQIDALLPLLAAPDQILVIMSHYVLAPRIVSGCQSGTYSVQTGNYVFMNGAVVNAAGPEDWFCTGGVPLLVMIPGAN